MPHVKVLVFATLRERLGGAREIEIELPPGATVRDLKERIAQTYPVLAENMKSVLTTINREYAFDETVLPDGAELAMFPPVSGGAFHLQQP